MIRNILLLCLLAIALYIMPGFGFVDPGMLGLNPDGSPKAENSDTNTGPVLQQANEPDYDLNPDLRSPLHALQTFKKGFITWDTEGQALSMQAMDIEFINHKIREVQGVRLAEILKSTLDQLDKKEIETRLRAVQKHQKAATLKTFKSGTITMSKDESGNWQFSAKTLRNMDAIFAEVVSTSGKAINSSQFSSITRMQTFLIGIHPSLIKQSLLIPNWQWLALLILVVLGAMIHGFISVYAHKFLSRVIWKRILKTTEMKKSIGKPLGLLAAALFWQATLPWVGLPPDAELVLLVSIRFIFSLATIWALWRLTDWICDNLGIKAEQTESKFDDLLVPMLRTGLRIFVIATGLLIIADALDLPVYTILSGMTIGSVALALAAKDTVENLFGSITVLMDRPFAIGDWVVIGNQEGTVEKVGFRSTRIRTFYNSVISLPNSTMITATVDNMGSRVYRRIKTNLGLTYDTPPEKIEAFCEGVRTLILNHPYTRKDYFHVYFNGFGASSLDIMLYCFVETPDWGTELREKQRMYLDILKLAKELGVDFAYPTQTLYMRNEEGWVNNGPESKKAYSEAEMREYSKKLSQQHFDENGNRPAPVES